MNKTPVTGFLVLISVLILDSCSRPIAPQYAGVAAIRINNIASGESDVSADLKFFNPNKFRMNLKNGSVDVFVNNRFIGKTLLDTLTQIPASDSFNIPVSMRVDMKQILANALDIFLSHEVLIKLDGSAKLGKSGLYFNVPIQYEGRQKIDLDLH